MVGFGRELLVQLNTTVAYFSTYLVPLGSAIEGEMVTVIWLGPPKMDRKTKDLSMREKPNTTSKLQIGLICPIMPGLHTPDIWLDKTKSG